MDTLLRGEPSFGTDIYFLATDEQIFYEIYIDELITYEPIPHKILHFSVNKDVSLKIRSLSFTKRGILKESSVLGVFAGLTDDAVYILTGKNTARLVSKNVFFEAAERFKDEAK